MFFWKSTYLYETREVGDFSNNIYDLFVCNIDIIVYCIRNI